MRLPQWPVMEFSKWWALKKREYPSKHVRLPDLYTSHLWWKYVLWFLAFLFLGFYWWAYSISKWVCKFKHLPTSIRIYALRLWIGLPRLLLNHNHSIFICFLQPMIAFSWKRSRWLISLWISFRSSGRGSPPPLFRCSLAFLGFTVFTGMPEKWSDGPHDWLAIEVNRDQIIYDRLNDLGGLEQRHDVTSGLGRKLTFFFF